MASDNRDEPDPKGDRNSGRELVPTGRSVGRRSFLRLAGAAATAPLVATRVRAAPQTHTLAVVSTVEPSETNELDVSYQFTATGQITPLTGRSDGPAEGNDSVSQNDDGTWTATGTTGNGFGDTYEFEGRVTDFTGQGAFELRLDGSIVSADELVQSGEHVVEVLTTTNPSELDYTLTTTGEIRPHTDNGDNSAEGNDSISQNDDGTWTADGYTGNGYGDAYYFSGELSDFGPVEDFVEVRVDGSAIDLSQFESSSSSPDGPNERVVEVLTTTNPSELDYTLTTTGEIRPHTDNGDNSAEGNDSISQNDDGTWTADGYTGNGYGDAYYFSGELSDFGPVEDFVEVRVDGSAIDLSQFETDTSVPNGSDDVIGGGDGYANAVPESAADVVVSTLAELESALNAASSGDVVYVAGDATIDASAATGTDRLSVPSGVTLASDRGVDGAPGGHITTTVVDYEHTLSAQRNARLTGVRISGPKSAYEEYNKPVSSGVTVEGTDVEIDNVEMWGFNHAAIKARHSVHVHHSHIHDNPMSGLGYGIQCLDGDSTLIEHNRFNFNRHCVANTGNAGYEVRFNHFAGNEAPSYQVGTHRPGGTTLEIHHNTFVPLKHMGIHPEEPGTHVSIRGVPDDVAHIHHNWFYNPNTPAPGRGNESIIQPHVDEFTNLEYNDNSYGTDEPSADIGCPR